MVVARSPPRAPWPRAGRPAGLQQRGDPLLGRQQLYGLTPERQAALREYAGGRLLLGEDGGLPLDPQTGVDLTG